MYHPSNDIMFAPRIYDDVHLKDGVPDERRDANNRWCGLSVVDSKGSGKRQGVL